MNKTIQIWICDGTSYENVQRHMEDIPIQFIDSCVFKIDAENRCICIEYTRPETKDEAENRFMNQRRKDAKKIIEGKKLAGEELPEWTRQI